MSLHKKTIRDINLHGKTVLVSADYNVPGDEHGRVTDDYRIKQSLPTLQYLVEQQCKIIIISHRGRPEGKVVPEYSLAAVAKRLAELSGYTVRFATDCTGRVAQQAKEALKPKEILLLENTRFHPEEEANDPAFAKALSEGADVFVQDAFGNAHRNHASMTGVARHLTAVAGLLIERELETILCAMESPERPVMAIIGGAKISDKIAVLERLLEVADFIAVGGGMANTFLAAEGYKVGNSLYEKQSLALARDILAKAEAISRKRPFTFLLPVDVVVSKDLHGKKPTRIVDISSHTVADIEAYPRVPKADSHTVGADELILDVGPVTAAMIAGAARFAKTVLWNGTLGVTETKGIAGARPPFAHGSLTVLRALEGEPKGLNRPCAVVGGGDTAGFVMEHAILHPKTQAPLYLSHVSTGGGASMELMSGKKLPGVEALEDKK